MLFSISLSIYYGMRFDKWDSPGKGRKRRFPEPLKFIFLNENLTSIKFIIIFVCPKFYINLKSIVQIKNISFHPNFFRKLVFPLISDSPQM